VPSSPPPPTTQAKDRILHLLKTKGPQASGALAKRLAVTPVAVRQHLAGLWAEGLVERSTERHGVGRPRQVWRVTPKADDRFPDSHAELAVGVLASVRAAFGPSGMARLLEERTARQAEAYRERVPPPSAPLADRVAALTRLRKEEGYMATWGRDEGGGFHLIENHCPICSAARSCTGLCDGELRLFQDVLGPRVSVVREEHILSGARRCLYRIAPRR
jgi:predicted ArsR family transcriptional regulator